MIILRAFILFWLLAAGIAYGNDNITKLKCGKANVIIYNSDLISSPFFAVNISHSNGVFNQSFSANKEFFEVRCEKGKEEKDYLLINHFCGGSGCAESNYAIVDPTTGELLLEPTDIFEGNHSKASSLLGKPIRPFSCLKYSRTTTSANDMNEYCLVSPLELD